MISLFAPHVNAFGDGVRIDRVWAMPNRKTFTIKPIKDLLQEEMNPGLWVDPFAGNSSFAQFTNDLNPETTALDHKDALEYVRENINRMVDGFLFDPPYSFRQSSECYRAFGREKLTAQITNKLYWSNLKDAMAGKIRSGGKFIGFGWNSMGLGKNRRFEMTRVLLVCHGGSMNDTIVTVEVKR